MEPIETTQALVLDGIAYGEADRIVTFFTEGEGLKGGYVRGARRSHRRFGGLLDPLTRVRLHYVTRSRSHLLDIRGCDLLDGHRGLKGSLEAMTLASLVVELVRHLTPEGERNDGIFHFLCDLCAHLSAVPYRSSVRLPVLLATLTLLGFGPHLSACIRCGREEGEAFRFSAKMGGILCRRCLRPEDGGTRLPQRLREGLLRMERMSWQDAEVFTLPPREEATGWRLLTEVATAVVGHEPRALRFARKIATFRRPE